MGETIKAICTAIASITTALVVGEVIGGAVSRPVAAWRSRQVNLERMAALIEVMNQRICNLEEKKVAE